VNPYKASLFAAVLTTSIINLSAEVIHVHVVDGRNGKTITNERVQVWINDGKGALNPMPGKDGIIEIDAPAGSRIRVESNLYFDCRPFEKEAARPSYSVDEIKISGWRPRTPAGS